MAAVVVLVLPWLFEINVAANFSTLKYFLELLFTFLRIFYCISVIFNNSFGFYMLSQGFYHVCCTRSKALISLLQCCDQSFPIRHCGQSKHTRGLFFHFLFATVLKAFLAVCAAAVESILSM